MSFAISCTRSRTICARLSPRRTDDESSLGRRLRRITESYLDILTNDVGDQRRRAPYCRDAASGRAIRSRRGVEPARTVSCDAVLVDRFVAELQPVAESKGVTSSRRSRARPLRVMGDPHEIRRAIVNLAGQRDRSDARGWHVIAARSRGRRSRASRIEDDRLRRSRRSSARALSNASAAPTGRGNGPRPLHRTAHRRETRRHCRL